MKAIFSLRRHHYLKTVSVFLIAVLLIVGVASCVGEPGETYSLTTVVNPAGGGTATDITGGSPYTALSVVNISAVADPCYRFVDWTAPAGLFTDANAAQTTFVMPAQDVTVTANFEAVPLSHFKGYTVNEATAPYMDKPVTLTDQFIDGFDAIVGEAIFFFNPTHKVHLGEETPIFNDNHHYAVYHLYYEGDYPVKRSVEVTNQFGTQDVSVYGPVALAVPTTKVEPGNHEDPECLDHLLLYAVEADSYMEEVAYVDLTDQFGSDDNVSVYSYAFFANPVQKTDTTGVTNIKVGEHMLFYWMDGTTATYDQVLVDNQFLAGQTFDLGSPALLLAVPSQKNVPPTPPLDHFKCYTIDTGPTLDGVYVYLEDQFGVYEDVPVIQAQIFCNPVDKVHDTLTATSNPDNHLTVFDITTTAAKDWSVTVDNQFGNGQEMIVYGPIGLVVPTQKVEPFYHEKPKYLDHYLLYYVEEGLNVTATVDLDDEFTGTAPDVEVTRPMFFATPAIKGHIDHVLDPWDPEGHLVFYMISPNEEFMPGVYVNNQFAPDGMPLSLDPLGQQFLAVPSVKVSYEPYIPL